MRRWTTVEDDEDKFSGGYALVVVPYWEWGQVRGDEAAEVEYLRGKLDSGVVGELAV